MPVSHSVVASTQGEAPCHTLSLAQADDKDFLKKMLTLATVSELIAINHGGHIN